MNLRESFLIIPPDECNEDADYQIGKERIRTLPVVNDAVKRDVNLFEEFDRLLTRKFLSKLLKFKEKLFQLI